MYRYLRNRSTGGAKPVKGLYTLEDRVQIRSSPRKKHPFSGTNFELVDKTKPDDEDNPHDFPNKSPWLYIVALEAMLQTFPKALTCLVKCPVTGEQVYNVARGPLEEHLANCRSFVLQWINTQRPPTEHLIVQQLARIDLSVRRRWWIIYREPENLEKTFTFCMKSNEDFAAQMWRADITVQMYPPSYRGDGPRTPIKKRKHGDWDNERNPTKTKGEGKGGKGGGKSAKISTSSALLGDKKVKTA